MGEFSVTKSSGDQCLPLTADELVSSAETQHTVKAEWAVPEEHKQSPLAAAHAEGAKAAQRPGYSNELIMAGVPSLGGAWPRAAAFVAASAPQLVKQAEVYWGVVAGAFAAHRAVSSFGGEQVNTETRELESLRKGLSDYIDSHPYIQHQLKKQYGAEVYGDAYLSDLGEVSERGYSKYESAHQVGAYLTLHTERPLDVIEALTAMLDMSIEERPSREEFNEIKTAVSTALKNAPEEIRSAGMNKLDELQRFRDEVDASGLAN